MEAAFRPVEEKDLVEINRIVNDFEVARYLTLIPPVSLEETRQHFAENKKLGNPWYTILVDGKIAGSFILRRQKGNNSHVAVFGINIDKPYWGHGVGAQALAYAEEEGRKIGVKKLELEVVQENERAVSLYEKDGFTIEGCKRKHTFVDEDYKDTLIMGKWIWSE
ncbi:Acetyltransferase (GNAT) family protein [uncultured archaeon]|nr:Acetyltransferase (GNAT) family protein [uncultured archaeon]